MSWIARTTSITASRSGSPDLPVDFMENEMRIAVLIEPNHPQGFRATAPTHPDVTAEGPTEDAAVQSLSVRLIEKPKQARIVTVEIPVKTDKPWMAAAGCMKDEPDQEAYWVAIFGHRRQVDADSTR